MHGESWNIVYAWGALLLVQLVTGRTLGSDRFRSFGDEPVPAGRWPRLVMRRDEPTFFWMLLVCQTALMLFCLWAYQFKPRAHGPRADVPALLREIDAQKK